MVKRLMNKEKPSNLVQPIEHTAKILGQHPNGLSLADLSEQVNQPKGTTRRILTSMVSFDFVRLNHINKVLPFRF